MKSTSLIVLFLTAMFAAACSKSAGPADTHALKGVIVDVFPEPPALLVEHEEIPGFMAAMTMRFAVDAAIVAKVKKADRITARLRFRDGTWSLEDVRVVENP